MTGHKYKFHKIPWGSHKKVIFLMVGHLEGGGVKGRAIKEKIFFLTFFPSVPKFQRPLSSRGEVFFAAFLVKRKISHGLATLPPVPALSGLMKCVKLAC